MAILCPKPVRGIALRVTELDSCGVPTTEATANTRFAGKGFVSLAMSPNIEDGDEITIKDASGDICISDIDCDRVRGYDVTLSLCGIPLTLLELILGMDLIVDGPDTIGAVVPDLNTNTACNSSVALEVWSRNADDDACSGSNPCPYVQFLLPKVSKWSLTNDVTFENASAVSFELSGFAENNAAITTDVGYSTESPWTAGEITQFQAGGPFGFKCTDTLPTLDDCGYLPTIP